MKKNMLALLLAALTILPLGTVALAVNEQASEATEQVQEFIPGSVPAETWAAEAMSPALHGAVLAMVNRQTSRFDPSDKALSWEALYNMLSLYGQLDSRTEIRDEQLYFPSETVYDYAGALALDLSAMGQMPSALSDRLTYDAAQDHYLAVCGNDDLAQLQIRQQKSIGGSLELSGSLTYLVDGSDLVRFTATLQPRDSMFGYAVTRLELTA